MSREEGTCGKGETLRIMRGWVANGKKEDGRNRMANE